MVRSPAMVTWAIMVKNTAMAPRATQVRSTAMVTKRQWLGRSNITTNGKGHSHDYKSHITRAPNGYEHPDGYQSHNGNEIKP